VISLPENQIENDAGTSENNRQLIRVKTDKLNEEIAHGIESELKANFIVCSRNKTVKRSELNITFVADGVDAYLMLYEIRVVPH
jgi:hypothetical protein